jgi:hypothetical protein
METMRQLAVLMYISDIRLTYYSIALKANSTNIVITDSVFYRGQGIAVGSIGQYPGVFEIIENFYVSNVTLHKTAYVSPSCDTTRIC